MQKPYCTVRIMRTCHICSARRPLTLWGMVVIDPKYTLLILLVWHEQWRGLDHVWETTRRVRGLLLRVDTTHIATLLAVYSTSCGSNQSTLQYNYSKSSTLWVMHVSTMHSNIQMELIRWPLYLQYHSGSDMWEQTRTPLSDCWWHWTAEVAKCLN